MTLMAHANIKRRSWPSQETIAKETGIGKNTVTAAIAWLFDHKMIYNVPPRKRVGDEKRVSNRGYVYQLTGLIYIDGVPIKYIPMDDETCQSSMREIEEVANEPSNCPPIVEGDNIPTSGIFDTHNVPVGGILKSQQVGLEGIKSEGIKNTLTAPHEGVPSAVALGGSDSTPKRNLPHHMLVDMPDPAAVKDEPPSELGAKRPDITGRSFVQFCMTEWNMNGLNDKLYKGFTDEAYEYYEGHRIPKGDLMSNWDHTPGFENFARSRFEMFRAKANREKAGSDSWAADYLSNLKKFSVETNGGKGWPGFNQWKRENPSLVKQVSRKDKPVVIEYKEMPDEGPKPWEVE